MLKATVNKLARRFELKNWLSAEVGTRSTEILKRMQSTCWRANPPSRGTCVGWRKGRQQPQETQQGQMRSPSPGTHSAPARGQSQMPGWGQLCREGLGARRGWGTGLVGGKEKALGGPKSGPPILMRRLPRGQRWRQVTLGVTAREHEVELRSWQGGHLTAYMEKDYHVGN